MKTTFDLSESLLRKAKATAARQGRPLRDLVAEAIDEKLRAQNAATDRAEATLTPRAQAWKAFAAKLKRAPDGTYVNPNGIDDDMFFKNIENLRTGDQAWTPRDPFAPK